MIKVFQARYIPYLYDLEMWPGGSQMLCMTWHTFRELDLYYLQIVHNIINISTAG